MDLGRHTAELASKEQFDLIIVPWAGEAASDQSDLDRDTAYILKHAHCRVFLAAAPAIPQEPER